MTSNGNVYDIASPMEMQSKLTLNPRESKLVAPLLGFKRAMIDVSKGKRLSVISIEEDIQQIRKRKLVLEAPSCTFKLRR